jgi:hypothetical protein
MLGEQVVPSGMSFGFGRLWLISGGNPVMVSSAVPMIEKEKIGWASSNKGKPNAN